MERNIADEIMDAVHRLQLPFIVDQLTEGRGNCFPIAVIQQCQRPEINKQLKSVTKMIVKTQRTGPRHKAFRYSVINFIKNSDPVGKVQCYLSFKQCLQSLMRFLMSLDSMLKADI